MSTNSRFSIIPSERVSEARLIDEAMQSFAVTEGDIEGLDSNLEFPDLKEKADEFATKGTFGNRPIGTHAAALYRSARYAVVGGVFCHTLAMRGKHRALYEGSRLLHPIRDLK